MTSQIVALDKQKHQNTRIKSDSAYLLTQNQHLLPLQAHEFTVAALNYPIVFVKDAESNTFRSVVMTGLEPGENLFYTPTEWNSYIPLAARTAPFVLIPKQNDTDHFTVCIDLGSPLVNESDGEKLFDEAGAESDFLIKKKNLMSTLINQIPITSSFINYLIQHELLSPMSLTINIENDVRGSYSLNGIYAVDNKKLNELTDSTFTELRKRGYLAPIYAHLLSLGAISTLAQKKKAKNNVELDSRA